MRNKRQRLKSARLQVVSRPTTHDRQSTDVPINAVVAPMSIDDPYGDRVVVLRSLRDDPLAALHSAGQIDQCQYVAGRHWQKAYELAEIGGARGIDTTRDYVDGGQIASPTISDVQARAIADLAKARRSLGDYGNSVIYDVLACHMTIKDCAARRMMVSEAERKYIGGRFRESLDTLAVIFGYSTKPLAGWSGMVYVKS